MGGWPSRIRLALPAAIGYVVARQGWRSTDPLPLPPCGRWQGLPPCHRSRMSVTSACGDWFSVGEPSLGPSGLTHRPLGPPLVTNHIRDKQSGCTSSMHPRLSTAPIVRCRLPLRPIVHHLKNICVLTNKGEHQQLDVVVVVCLTFSQSSLVCRVQSIQSQLLPSTSVYLCCSAVVPSSSEDEPLFCTTSFGSSCVKKTLRQDATENFELQNMLF